MATAAVLSLLKQEQSEDASVAAEYVVSRGGGWLDLALPGRKHYA
jgi:hypothetical protein